MTTDKLGEILGTLTAWVLVGGALAIPLIALGAYFPWWFALTMAGAVGYALGRARKW